MPFPLASSARRAFAPALTIVLSAALTAAVVLPLRAEGEGETPPPGNPTKGKVVYEKNCVPCHKQDGTGGIKLQPAGNPSRNFRDPQFWKGRHDPEIQKAIETGFPKSGMVPWKGVLKPQEIRDVIAYLRAKFQPKETKEAAAEKPAEKPAPGTAAGASGR